MPQDTRGETVNLFPAISSFSSLRRSRDTRSDPRDAWMAAAIGSRAEHSHPRKDRPLPERIWDAVRLSGPLDERLEIIDHLSECPTCAEAWSLAAELATANEHSAQPDVN